ncbi:MAG: helix-turn-helix domain-containing protein [Chitinophagaceae bacterium]
MFNDDLKTKLSIIWNIGKTANFYIDKEKITVKKNCIIFLTELHKIKNYDFDQLHIIQFNKDFHCIENHDTDIACKGLLFFGSSHIPKITIPNTELNKFNLLWDVFQMELDENDQYKLEMLRSLLKRFLIICVREYRKKHFEIAMDTQGIAVIREYNYLVEQHFKTLTKVSDYANLLYKSPKTLSNTFSKYIDKSPLQIINNRRLLEAKRQLLYTDMSVNEIADDLSFTDIQAFSHFFKKQTGKTPSDFKLNT